MHNTVGKIEYWHSRRRGRGYAFHRAYLEGCWYGGPKIKIRGA